MSTQPTPLDNVVYEADPAPYPLRLLLWTFVVALPAWLFADLLVTPFCVLWVVLSELLRLHCGLHFGPCLDVPLFMYLAVCAGMWTWNASRIVASAAGPSPRGFDRLLRALTATGACLPCWIILSVIGDTWLRWQRGDYLSWLLSDLSREWDAFFPIMIPALASLAAIIYTGTRCFGLVSSSMEHGAYSRVVWRNFALLIIVVVCTISWVY